MNSEIASSASTPAAVSPRTGAGRARIQRRPVHGVLLLDKPLGLSSHEALQKAKWLLRAEKAGHTGTLDPLATGLLPLCFGAATKFSQVSLDADKVYEADVQLGTTTDSGDAEGRLLQCTPVHVTAEQVQAILDRFRGEIEQVPPMHSALKKGGKPLYEYARQGLEVERIPRRVQIHQLQGRWRADQPDRLHLTVRCSKGTYIRTLAQDIGLALGCGASLAGLRRLASGPLRVDAAISLEDLARMDESERLGRLLPADTLLLAWPAVELEQSEAARFLTGLRRRLNHPDCAAVRVYGPVLSQTTDRRPLLGSAHIRAGELIPDRLLSPLEVQAQA
ncbi:MAG: tRNA pseudouridine(55) synthase TruB [Burkholderiaceae bacterium]|jgi:tRNA pseudouridine55 synthase